MRSRLRISDLSPAAALLLLAGCSSSGVVERYPRGGSFGNQGDSAELVFAPAESRLESGWELARLDDTLNIRTAAQSDNPNPPDLGQLRRYYLTPRADQIIYFEQRPPRHW